MNVGTGRFKIYAAEDRIKLTEEANFFQAIMKTFGEFDRRPNLDEFFVVAAVVK